MDQELKDKIKQLQTIQLVKNYYLDLKQKEAIYKSRKIELEYLLKKRVKLLDKLLTPSLLGNYLKIIGKKEDALEVSKKYYFDLVMEYHEVVGLIEKLNFEKDIIEEKSRKLDDLKKDFKEKIAARDDTLRALKSKELLRVIKLLDNKIALNTEIDEAVTAGHEVVECINATLKYIIEKSASLKKELRSDKKVFAVDLRNIELYQIQIINIRHSMLKFESEVNDIYKFMFNDNSRTFSIGDNFLQEHRNKFFDDINNKENLVKCYEYLKNQKELVQSFICTLRKDFIKLEKEIEVLESLEESLISEL